MIRTCVYIRNNDLRTLIRKQPRSLRTNALSRARNDGDLARQHTLGVVEVARDLVDSFRHCDRLSIAMSSLLWWGLRPTNLDSYGCNVSAIKYLSTMIGFLQDILNFLKGLGAVLV